MISRLTRDGDDQTYIYTYYNCFLGNRGEQVTKFSSRVRVKVGVGVGVIDTVRFGCQGTASMMYYIYLYMAFVPFSDCCALTEP